MGEFDKRSAAPTSFEEVRPMVRPTGVQNGIVEADPEKCTGCGVCLQNCPFRCLELDANDNPTMKHDCICFSCANCTVACPEQALSLVRAFRVSGGFFDTDFPPVKMPREPLDAFGKPASWTEVERLILERRSVRNFAKTPIPEPLLRRVLEAGRFAPSGGNHQPWKFTVVTDPEFLQVLETAVQAVWEGMHAAFADDAAVMNLVGQVPTGVFDPRVQYGIGCIARKDLPVFFKAPAVIFLACNQKMAIPEMEAGICGENMNLAAMALGLGCAWSNFGAGVNFIPELKAKLGFGEDWTVETSLCLGYPKFKQQGMVPRHYRPVMWFRAGSQGPETEE
ncbi:MAG: nitroreductase family protein [Deltaproteobacteria bacterium]|nr:nitroreductase family protein [Deltaproteobacteria bacterium]